MAKSWAKELMSMLAAAVLTGAVTASAAAQPCELQVVAPDAFNGSDSFGISVSARQEFFVVGDFQFGRCYVYRREEAQYVLDEKIEVFAEDFGSSVSYANEWLMVGAAWISATPPGTMHFLRRDSDGWQYVQGFDAPMGSPIGFGHVVALNASATHALVGVPRSSEQYPGGVVFAYTREGETWLEDGVITLPDAQAKAEFGFSLDFNVDVAVVGAPSYPGGGRVFVFERMDDAWALQATLSSPVVGDTLFGFAVARAGTLLAVGSRKAASLFRFADRDWVHEAQLPLLVLDGVQAVATDGVHVAVGQPWWNGQFGRVEVYKQRNRTWQHAGTLQGTFFENYFGWSLSLSDERLFIGWPISDSAGLTGKAMIAGLTPALCCPADCNEDGTLDILDFLCFQGLVFTADPKADCNDDGVINIFDFLCFQGLFTTGCP
jgi:hypothetical protein